MAKRFWQTEAFKALEALWRERLSQSGFVDAEVPIKGKYMLRQKAANCYRQACEVVRENKLRYYELLGSNYHKEVFSDSVEKFVMEQRSCGVKIKIICQSLKAMGERCHRETIRNIIRKYEVKWAMRKLA